MSVGEKALAQRIRHRDYTIWPSHRGNESRKTYNASSITCNKQTMRRLAVQSNNPKPLTTTDSVCTHPSLIHTHTHKHTRTNTNTRACAYTQTHNYTYTHTHTHTQAHIQAGHKGSTQAPWRENAEDARR